MSQVTQVDAILSVATPDGTDFTKPVAFTQQLLNAIDGDVDLNEIVSGKWTFDFGPVGFVPGTKDVAFGFFRLAAKKLEIRFGMNTPGAMPFAKNLTKQQTLYTEAHEWMGHGWDFTKARMDQREAILVEMKLGKAIAIAEAELHDHDKAVVRVWNRGTTPMGQPVRYWDRPYEAAADMTVSALTALPSIFAYKYIWDIDADRLKEIILTPAPANPPPPPPPPPDPDPLPPDPDLVVKVAALEKLLGEIATDSGELAAANLTLSNKAKGGIG